MKSIVIALALVACCASLSQAADKTLKIYVKSSDGNILSYYVQPENTVLSLKQSVQLEEGIEAKDQIYILGGSELEDDKRIMDYKISSETVINQVNRHLIITVNSFNAKVLEIPALASDTVATIKQKIFDSEGLPINQQMIVGDKEELPDNYTMLQYSLEYPRNIRDKGLFVIRHLFPGFLKFTAESSDGKVVALEAMPEDTILYSKKQIASKLNLPLEAIELEKDEKKLADEKTVQECRIQDSSDLKLIINQK